MTTSSTTCAADWRSTDRRQSALAVVLRSRTGHLKPAWGTGGSGSQGLCPRSFGKAFFFGGKLIFPVSSRIPAHRVSAIERGVRVSGRVRAHTGKFRAGNSPASMKRKCCRRKTSCVLRCTSCRGGMRPHSVSRQEPRGRFQQTMSRRNNSPGSEDARLGRQLRGIRLSAPAGGRKSS